MMNEIFAKPGEIKMNEWISILAVLTSPLIAVCVTIWVEKRGQKRKDKMDLFKVMMTQRGTTTTELWVNALNSMPIVFSEDKEVLSALNVFLDTTKVNKPEDMDIEIYENKKIKLLEVMANSLGYSNINWEQIKSPYQPSWINNERIFNSKMKECQLKFAEMILSQTKNPEGQNRKQKESSSEGK